VFFSRKKEKTQLESINALDSRKKPEFILIRNEVDHLRNRLALRGFRSILRIREECIDAWNKGTCLPD
jgi:hypothetical protein